MRLLRSSLCIAACALLVACGTSASDSGAADTGTPQGDTAGSDGTAGGDASGDAPDTTAPSVDRGPSSRLIDGDPNGVWWDAASGTLYIADDNGNRLLRWTDAGFQEAIPLPEVTDERGPGLGQVILTADGTLAVTRFGFGTLGDIVTVSPDGQAAVVPNLDPIRRRIGLSVAPDGAVYVAWFTGERDNRVGGVSRVDLQAGGEQDVTAPGLIKPVGVLATDQTLYIADQAEGRVVTVPLTGGEPQTFATVPSADLLAITPSGALLTGGRQGEVYRVGAGGEVSTVQGGFQEVRGLAFDAANQRLFVVDHDPDETDGIAHRLHILPLEDSP